ncbi:hypothetical protein HMPREF1246_1523 [Acidaminococcus sp. BV3L6]|nr:hypothetical protein HMPREF1246_1523 [Acidaminococcus sp. BV3L6]
MSTLFLFFPGEKDLDIRGGDVYFFALNRYNKEDEDFHSGTHGSFFW